MPRYQDVAESDLRFRQVHLDFHTSEHCPDVGSDFDPDEVMVDKELQAKLNSFIACGGAILSSGTSGLNAAGDAFMIDFGADYAGESEWEQDYLVVGALGDESIPASPMIMYTKVVNLIPRDCEVLASIRPPYFNRACNHFCSHQNTSYGSSNSPYPAAVKKGNIIHFAHRVFTAYRTHRQQYLRDVVMNALDLLCPERRVQVNMPSGGRMTFMRQDAENRWILHLLYAAPMHRGESIDVIEDIIPLYNITCSVSFDKKPIRLYLASSGEELAFEWKNGRVHFTVPELVRHAMVVIE